MARPADKSTALWALRRLRKAGYQALFAGGCVRDMLLGVVSADYDVATNATPRQVKQLFGHVLLVGAKFGVAMVIHKGRKVEVTTFRTDLAYRDHRRPETVRFSSPREDALRRDFTINGMFYDPISDEVIDYVGGQKDLARKLVRTIGPPQQRFCEDYLRMMRAVRFAVRLGFSIAPETAAAIRKYANRIGSISGERIFDELQKMLSDDSAAEALEIMHKLSLAQVVLPELFADSLWDSALRRAELNAAGKDPVLAIGCLLAELKPSTIARVIRRWGGSNELRNAICWMAEHLDDWRTAGGEMPLADFKRLLANPNIGRLKLLWRVEERLETNRDVCCRRISRRASAIDPKKISPRPLLAGKDLIRLGLKEGPRLGKILNAIYDAQLNEQIATRSEAIKTAKQMFAESP